MFKLQSKRQEDLRVTKTSILNILNSKKCIKKDNLIETILNTIKKLTNLEEEEEAEIEETINNNLNYLAKSNLIVLDNDTIKTKNNTDAKFDYYL
jgi:dephospho-CoA kinase